MHENINKTRTLLILGVLKHFPLKNRTIKIDKVHEEFDYIQSFCAKMFGYSHYMYWLQRK